MHRRLNPNYCAKHPLKVIFTLVLCTILLVLLYQTFPNGQTKQTFKEEASSDALNQELKELAQILTKAEEKRINIEKMQRSLIGATRSVNSVVAGDASACVPCGFVAETFVRDLPRQGDLYQVSPELECWQSLNCPEGKLNNIAAYEPCGTKEASSWNIIGVQEMERYVANNTNEFEQNRFLQRAIEYFEKATEIDPLCARAQINLALALLEKGDLEGSLQASRKAVETDIDNPSYWAIRGFIHDYKSDRKTAMRLWEKATTLDPTIGERRYLGIILVNDTVPEKHIQFPITREYYLKTELEACKKALIFIEFSRVSISNYAILTPGGQDFFLKNHYIILRSIIPPFVLKGMQNAYQKMIADNRLNLGDGQSKRYNAYNERVGRMIQHQLVDLFRRVTLHNLLPTYAFFGGYVAGAELPPHSDKPQCEFTLTLTINQPEGVSPWPVSLGRNPNFIKNDDFIGNPKEKLPSDEDTINALLYPGDGLLFMGRHHTHFRKTALPPNQWLHQLFLHHVQSDFKGIRDI